MIQVYSPNNTNYTKNGNAVIFPISCEITAEINGTWILELVTPLDDEGRWKLLEANAVIKAPSFNGNQLFRIRQTSKQDSGVTVTAEPIFLDSVGDCFILDARPTNKTGQEALDIILAPNNKYTGRSNITTRTTAYFIRKNAMEAIAGNDDISFLSRWGGEIYYDNFTIYINDRVGGDYGVELLYGKNIPVDGVKESVDMEGVVTRIIPKAYNGYLLPGSSPWVDSPVINAYPTIFTKVIDFENIRLASDITGEVEEGVIVCQTLTELYNELRTAAAEQFANGIDKPKVTISADMVILSNTEEYKEYADLEKVSLGDTIHLKHKRLGIVSDARIVALVYDSCRESVTGVTIGDITPSFLDKVASTVGAVNKAITQGGLVKAEQINGFIDGLRTQLRIQNTVAERQEARAILFEDLDPNSPTFGALSIGTQGWQISQERTPDDRDWVWTTAATGAGLIADAITTGTLDAIDITGVNITGSDITGTNISGTNISGSTITGSTITGGSLHTTGDTDPDDTRDGDVWIQDGYVKTTTIDENNKDCIGISNGQFNQVTKKENGTTLSFSNIQSSGRVFANNGTYTCSLNGTSGRVQIANNSTSTTNYAIMNADNGSITLRGSTTSKTIGLNADNQVIQIIGDNSVQMGLGFQTSRYGYVWDGSKYVWSTNHIAGEVLDYGAATFPGHITNGSKRIVFFIPLNATAEGVNATVTLPSNLSIRGINGYVGGQMNPDVTGWTVSASTSRNGVLVTINTTDTLTNATNNTPVTVYGSFSIRFS